MSQTIAMIHDVRDTGEKKDTLMRTVRELPKTMSSMPEYESGLHFIRQIEHAEERRSAVIEFLELMPRSVDFLPLHIKAYGFAIETVNEIADAKHRKAALMRVAEKIPQGPEYISLYKKAMELAIEASHAIDDRVIRRYSLVDIAEGLPKNKEFIPLYLHAMRIALDLSEDPAYRKHSLPEIAKELPKSSDYAFYRKYTLLGMASDLVRTAEAMPLYMEAMKMAMEAADIITEPYYRKYAYMFIAAELPKTPAFLQTYKQAMEKAYEAAMEINDPFGKKYALIEIIKTLPRTNDFLSLLLKSIEQILSFFTVKKWIDDVRITDVIDFILAAEDKSMHDGKKHKFTKEKYAKIFAAELDELSREITDIRLIEILKPYTHVWIQPKILRDAAQKVVSRIEALKGIYHGKDIERPLFVKEHHPVVERRISPQPKNRRLPKECLAIDLGATNTVIMKKKGDAQPDFIVLDSLSGHYGDTSVIPTVINTETNTIGLAAAGAGQITDIKRMLMDNKPKSREHMEKYFQILYKHLKKGAGSGWFPGISGSLADAFFVTTPIGFQHYRKSLKEIIEKTFKGVRPEFIEEPLAASIGYQIAETRDKIVMVIDFGGCTMDVMLLRLNLNEVHVVAKPERSLLLGGKDIDLWLAEYLAEKAGLHGKDMPQELISKAEEIKIALSDHNSAPFEWNGAEVCRVARNEFEEILSGHDFYSTIDRAVAHVIKKAEKVGITKAIIEDILLTGGSSQIPSFKEKIGHSFADLRDRNAIYDHSPLSAVARGAALYATRDVTDRHLGLAYAIRYITRNSDAPFSYDIILEKGEPLPFEKTFMIAPARALGPQNEVYIEMAEVPETHLTRRWVTEGGMEYLRQAIRQDKDPALKSLKTIAMSFEQPIEDAVNITFCVDMEGQLEIKTGKDNKLTKTGLRLQ